MQEKFAQNFGEIIHGKLILVFGAKIFRENGIVLRIQILSLMSEKNVILRLFEAKNILRNNICTFLHDKHSYKIFAKIFSKKISPN